MTGNLQEEDWKLSQEEERLETAGRGRKTENCTKKKENWKLLKYEPHLTVYSCSMEKIGETDLFEKEKVAFIRYKIQQQDLSIFLSSNMKI